MKRWTALLAAFCVGLAAGAALAQTPPHPVVPADRAMRMTEAVGPADFQRIEGGPLLLAAYAVVWAIFFFAALTLFWRLRKISSEIRRIERRLEEADRGP